MYYEHFGLKENPFHTTPDPRYLYLSRGHQEAMDHLVYGITQRKGFVMITGGVGTGKTTLLRSLLADLDQNVKTALVINPFLTADDLLPTICDEFGISVPQASGKKAYLDAINTFLLENFAADQNVVLLLDEAQNLSRDVLEQVRILSNLETEREKLLQIVLVGQEELVHLLSLNELRQLNERIVVRYSLDALDYEDVKAYVHHRMMVAGCKGRMPFTSGAIKMLNAASKGIPRRINAICDRALLAAYSRSLGQIDKNLIAQAAKEVTGHIPDPPQAKRLSLSYVALVVVLALAAVLGVAYGYWQGNLSSQPLQVAQMDVVEVAPVKAPETPQVQPVLAPEVPPPPVPDPIAVPVVEQPIQIEPEPVAPPAEIQETVIETPEVPGVEVVTPPAPEAETPPATPEIQTPPVQEVGGWSLDAEASLARLFSLYGADQELQTVFKEEQAGIVSFRASGEIIRFFRRPFRASIRGLGNSPGGHAVVQGTLAQGYILSDAAGNMVEVSLPDFEALFSGGLVWLIPEKLWINRISSGMKGPMVTWVQEVLIEAGYVLDQDGVCGPQTSRAIKSFQRDFGMRADGVAGPSTIGLLYQLADRLPEVVG